MTQLVIMALAEVAQQLRPDGVTTRTLIKVSGSRPSANDVEFFRLIEE